MLVIYSVEKILVPRYLAKFRLADAHMLRKILGQQSCRPRCSLDSKSARLLLPLHPRLCLESRVVHEHVRLRGLRDESSCPRGSPGRSAGGPASEVALEGPLRVSGPHRCDPNALWFLVPVALRKASLLLLCDPERAASCPSGLGHGTPVRWGIRHAFLETEMRLLR